MYTVVEMTIVKDYIEANGEKEKGAEKDMKWNSGRMRFSLSVSQVL